MKKLDHYNFFSLYIKISETTYYQRNRETILNRAKDYYQNSKEVLKDKASDKKESAKEIDIKICVKKTKRS